MCVCLLILSLSRVYSLVQQQALPMVPLIFFKIPVNIIGVSTVNNKKIPTRMNHLQWSSRDF
jgi:hypothetical protein